MLSSHCSTLQIIQEQLGTKVTHEEMSSFPWSVQPRDFSANSRAGNPATSVWNYQITGSQAKHTLQRASFKLSANIKGSLKAHHWKSWKASCPRITTKIILIWTSLKSKALVFNYAGEHFGYVVIAQKSKQFPQAGAVILHIYSTPCREMLCSLAVKFLFHSRFVNQFPLPIQTKENHIPAYFICLFALQRNQSPCKRHFKLLIFMSLLPIGFLNVQAETSALSHAIFLWHNLYCWSYCGSTKSYKRSIFIVIVCLTGNKSLSFILFIKNFSLIQRLSCHNWMLWFFISFEALRSFFCYV